MNPQFWWYVTRASGIVAWLMLTGSVVWGVILATKAFPEHRRPAWLLDLHRWLGALTIVFVGLHMGALVADNYVHFDLVDLLVPFASSWRTAAVAVGVIAFWLLVAVQVSSSMMRRLPRRLWRYIHLTSYLTFWLTSIHAALAGTDRTNLLYQATATAAIVAVMWSLGYRLLRGSKRRRAARRPTHTRDRSARTSHEREGDASDVLPPPDGVTIPGDQIDAVEALATLAGGRESN